MRFSLKVFFSTLLITTILFSAGSYCIISNVFHTAMDRETRLAVEENQMLRLSFENAAARAPSPLTINAARRIMQSLEYDSGSVRYLRLLEPGSSALYSSAGFPGELPQPGIPETDQRSWCLSNADGSWFILTICQVSVGDQFFGLESVRDITYLFQQRAGHFSLYRWLMVAILLIISAVMYILSQLLTAPIRSLSNTTRRFSAGDYSLRAKVSSQDEIGSLTDDFNTMADRLEQKILDLEDAAQRQEEFIASFAHELKTPLTAVIGYADMLRSQNLSPEERFHCADYIYREGHRLESLSFKLLELIVLKRQEFSFRPESVEVLALQLRDGLSQIFSADGIQLEIHCTPAVICCEPDLLKTALLNLCDNARKASPPNSVIILCGTISDQWYSFTVIDHGIGMTPEQLSNATQPFYMADKSRSRAQNGAGLGLSLCAAVAELHGDTLTLQSTVNQGTSVTLRVPLGGEQPE